MNNAEIRQAAWEILLSGAESYLEDWIDEEGEYGKDYEAIFKEAFELLHGLQEQYL